MDLKTLTLSLSLAACQHSPSIQEKVEEIIWTDKTQDFYNSLNTLYKKSLARGKEHGNPGHFVCGTIEVHNNKYGRFVLYTIQRDMNLVATDEGLTMYNEKRWDTVISKQCSQTGALPSVPLGFSPSLEDHFFVVDDRTFKDGTMGSVPVEGLVNYEHYPAKKRVSIDDSLRLMIKEASANDPIKGVSMTIKLNGFYEL
jgi:hypothetical protein